MTYHDIFTKRSVQCEIFPYHIFFAKYTNNFGDDYI